jgi:signal peptidase I
MPMATIATLFPIHCPCFPAASSPPTPRAATSQYFVSPKDPTVDYVKRVVGLPGDRIQMQDGQLVINDHRVARERLKDSLNAPAGSIPAPR